MLQTTQIRPIVSEDEYIVVDMKLGRVALRLCVEAIPLSQLAGFSDVQYVDHTKIGLEVAEGSGLRGGGDATAKRSLRLDVGNLPPLSELDGKQSFPVAEGRTTILKLNLFLDHDKLSNMLDVKHIDHSKVGIEPGTGLAGGGDLCETRVLRLALSSLESYMPDRRASVPFVDVDKTHGKISLETLFGLFRDWMKEDQNAI